MQSRVNVIHWLFFCLFTSMLLLVLLASWLLPTSVGAQGSLTFQDPGFEQWTNTTTPAGWTYSTLVEQSTTAHSGNYAARLTSGSPVRSGVQQDYPQYIATPFTIQVYAYAENASATLAIGIVDYEGDGPALCLTDIAAGSWQLVTCSFSAWQTPIISVVLQKYSGSGVLLIDDASYVSPATATSEPTATATVTPTATLEPTVTATEVPSATPFRYTYFIPYLDSRSQPQLVIHREQHPADR